MVLVGKALFRLNHRHIFVALIIASLIVVLLGSVWFWFSYKNAENTIRNQFHQSQLILVKTGASALEGFINERKAEIVGITEGTDIDNHLLIYKDKFQKLPHGVSGLGLIDKEGKIAMLVNSDNSTEGLGTDLSDRPYFEFVKDSSNRGEVFVTEPLTSRAGATYGKPAVLFASGIYDQNNNFNGLIVLSVLSEYLKDKFVIPLKSHEDSRPFILDDNLTIISGEYESLIGQNIYEYVKTDNWDKAIKKGEAGYTEWYWKDPQTQEESRKLVAFAPVNIGEGRNWYLVLSTPYESIFSSLKRLTFNQSLGLAIGFSLLVIFVIIFDLGLHIAQKDGYERAYREFVGKFKKKIKI